jgi:hypothetical protein
MAKSITQAQAEALAEGFFDDIGSEKEGLRPRKTLAKLYQLAGGLVDEAQKNLNASDRIASGALSDSIKVLDPRVVNGVNIVIDIQALFYYKFIDAGVRGTKSGSSSKGYSYKNKMPPVSVIKKWLIKEGIKGKRDKKYRGISRRDDFRKSISDTSRSTAYAIAMSIKQKGLKRTNFFVKAVSKTKAVAKEELSKSFKIDIINSIPKKI